MKELTDTEAEELHQALLTVRQELQKLLEDSAQGAEPVSLDQPIGRLSRMDAMQQQSMVQANRRAAELRLKRVETALRRHSEGEYGLCLECEEDVGYARLKARPEAPFCVDCQGRREQQ
jgi:DnaK suppressor protein